MITYVKFILFIFSLSVIFPTTSVFADDKVYGWQLMSEQERKEHRTKMQSLKTEQERNRYRLEHHKKMEQRAKKQGKLLHEMKQNRNNMMEQRGGGMGSGSDGSRGR